MVLIGIALIPSNHIFTLGIEEGVQIIDPETRGHAGLRHIFDSALGYELFKRMRELMRRRL